MSHHPLYVVRFHTEKERGKGNPSTHLVVFARDYVFTSTWSFC